MSLKNTLNKLVGALPIVSFIRCDLGKDVGKALGHSAYAVIFGTYILTSLAAGTPNPSRWVDDFKEIQRERWASRNQLYDRAINCVEEDGIPGLSSLGEIDKLYSRAGVSTNVGFHPRKAIVDFPKLTGKDLEKVVQNCKTEEGKIK